VGVGATNRFAEDGRNGAFFVGLRRAKRKPSKKSPALSFFDPRGREEMNEMKAKKGKGKGAFSIFSPLGVTF
jgi:hypothetical protein